MKETLRNTLGVLFILSVVLISVSYGYEKGKIDMHGGKGDALTQQSAFNMASALGSVLNKKGSDEQMKKEESKNFIKIESIEKIENEDIK